MRHSKKERYYSIEHCAEMLDLSQEFFRKRIRLHQITYAKIGKSVRIPESALYDLVEVRKSAHDLVKEKA
jgi:excisionase family DNA binding protein